MEIPVINRIGEFDAAITSLPNSNFLSQILASLSFAPPPGFSHTQHFLKWSALIIALVATFSGVVRRIKIAILSYPSQTHPLTHPYLPRMPEADDGFSGDDTEESFSSSSSDEEGEDDEPASTSTNWERTDRDFNVRDSAPFSSDSAKDRSFILRRRFSWSDLAPGKSVVKIWENLRLEFDVDESFGSDQISIYDINKEQKIKSIIGEKSEISSFCASSRSMIVSAGTEASGKSSVKLWDNRMGCQMPAIITEWKPRFGKMVGVWSGSLHKLYVGGEVRGELGVADVRSPLQSMGEGEGEVDRWWDADAVVLTE